MVTNRWTQKIAALLHDPPDKPFAIAEHGERAAELQFIALGRPATPEERRRSEGADRIASAADRVDFPQGSEAYWHQGKAILTHPLAGRGLDLGRLADVNSSGTHEAARRVVGKLVQKEPDPQRRFLRLWRHLPDALAEEFPRVGKLFGMLPADTRQPDHPLHQHLSLTAALATSLPRPALLVCSIGPVQEFIAAARRTQDLWMGSYLLSYLIWAALRTLAETYGPDAILFPSLRGQPLCDLWLGKEKGLECPVDQASLSLATLPNKFVALLPAEEAAEAARAAEKAIRKEWERLAEKVYTALKGIMPADSTTRQIWQRQIEEQLEIYWALLPWAGAEKNEGKERAEAVQALFTTLCPTQDGRSFGKIYDLYERSGHYSPNWGTTYGLLYTLADRAFGARKGLRDFTPSEERGEKCTLCGQRAALQGQDASRTGVRSFWSRVAKSLYAEVRPDGRERLCAVCTVKRFAWREVFREELELEGGFPSTSEVSAASFKAGVLKELSSPRSNQALLEALKEYLELLEIIDFPKTAGRNAIPYLYGLLRSVPQEAREWARKLLEFDGEVLFAETLTAKRLQDEYGLSVGEHDAAELSRSLGKLLRAASEANIPKPSKYYAILYMDGDRAGQWLSGTHEGMTSFASILHPQVQEQLSALPGWQGLLQEKRLMTPALHAAISEALAHFALKVVRRVVEERHPGRVVYAGGDDVLALLPLSEALLAAQELRALFSGEVLPDGEARDLRSAKWKVSFGNQSCTGYLWFDGSPLLTMGPKASASIGLALSHHLQPLDAALGAARQAEQTAKEDYGRNALCLYLLKRSGEEIRVGARWFYQEAARDVVTLVLDAQEKFQAGKLSMRLAPTVFEEAPTLAFLPKEAQLAELKRLLKRHSESKMSDSERQELAERLAGFASALDMHTHRPGLEQMAEWLLLVRFLARGGEE